MWNKMRFYPWIANYHNVWTCWYKINISHSNLTVFWNNQETKNQPITKNMTGSEGFICLYCISYLNKSTRPFFFANLALKRNIGAEREYIITWTGRFLMMNRNSSQDREWLACLYFLAFRWGGLKPLKTNLNAK